MTQQQTPQAPAALLETLRADRETLTRSSTSGRVAALLRDHITAGRLPPGTRLSEEQLGAALGVSRNTLREAFRLLTHEGLLVHRLHRGVFVPRLDQDDVAGLYELRRLLEGQAVRSLSRVPAARWAALWAEVERAERAGREGRWADIGTANMHFHQHLVGLLGNRRVDQITGRVLAELRLAFHVTDQRSFYESFLPRNRELVTLLEAGDMTGAADALEQYLRDSEAGLVAAYRKGDPR